MSPTWEFSLALECLFPRHGNAQAVPAGINLATFKEGPDLVEEWNEMSNKVPSNPNRFGFLRFYLSIELGTALAAQGHQVAVPQPHW